MVAKMVSGEAITAIGMTRNQAVAAITSFENNGYRQR